MSKKLTPYQIKKANEAAKEAACLNALAIYKKKSQATDLGAKKRKELDVLSTFVSVQLDDPRQLRSADTYLVRSYNLGRQILGLIDHIFVGYPVPLFLYRAVLTVSGCEKVLGETDGRSRVPQWQRELFFVAAQGGSIAKALKERLTKREAHFFMQAPANNTIKQNLFWAQCAAAGLAPKGCQYLVERLMVGDVLALLGDRLQDVLRFYANEYAQINEYTRSEITDYIRAVAADQSFSFKGRTLGSILKLSNEWHMTGLGSRVGKYVSWAMTFPTWEVKLKSELVRAVELTNNRALAEEGRKQRHCVYTYTGSCLSGWARIVSLRWIERVAGEPDRISKRITVEIAPQRRAIVQARGGLNRGATDDELKVLRLWAGTVGLAIERE